MAITVKSFSEIKGMDVFTNKGAYGGKAMDVEIDLDKFRIKSIIVDAVRGSFLASLVGDKRGVVIPYSMVDNMGDIIIIKHISPTSVPEMSEEGQ